VKLILCICQIQMEVSEFRVCAWDGWFKFEFMFFFQKLGNSCEFAHLEIAKTENQFLARVGLHYLLISFPVACSIAVKTYACIFISVRFLSKLSYDIIPSISFPQTMSLMPSSVCMSKN